MTAHVESANENDVMREQLEYLIDHTGTRSVKASAASVH